MPRNTDRSESLRVRQVAVLIETETSWGRRVIHGIANYADKHCLWNLLIDPRDNEQRSALPEGWPGDGIIGRISSRLQADQIVGKGLPAVNVDDLYDLPNVGKVMTDESKRADMALEHLLARGFRCFGYFAPPSHRYTARRGESFSEAVQAAGHTCHIYRPGYRPGRRISWLEQQRRVRRWLKSLPKPVAILTVDAYHARQLAEVCHFRDVRVPDDVAILAGDSDELLCEVATPPLSSLSLACERIGYEAASMLHAMLVGEAPPDEAVLIEPQGVTSRQSTDLLAIDDAMIVRALRYIQLHAHHGLNVQDILREVPISRRSLEIQFKSYLGRSPAEEIRRVRLERGKELLAKMDMSITEIALACGFSNATRFGIAFRNCYGTTPRSFRKTLHTDG